MSTYIQKVPRMPKLPSLAYDIYYQRELPNNNESETKKFNIAKKWLKNQQQDDIKEDNRKECEDFER